jgi:hypothetical protein
MADSTPPTGITPEMFRKWRTPIRGALNPQLMTNPVWKWLIESRLDAHQANALFSGDSAKSAAPGWCFDRFGQSRTPLPDGRTVWIAGEHEDYYHPDFFIYNDVVVKSPQGEIEIYGYPPDIFPPTDFHSANLVNGRLIIIGNLGYGGQRRQGVTQVLALELNSWQILRLSTEGAGPGWIHGHSARLEDDGGGILISGGQVDRCDGASLVENFDDWRLSVADWRWERLTTRRWTRFEAYRQDQRTIHLWEMRQVLWSKEVGWDDQAQWESKLQAELGSPARLDIVPVLYQPGIPHEVLPKDPDKYGVYRVRIDNVVVRYMEDTHSVQVTVEGELPAEVIEHIRDDLIEKLEVLEQSPIEYRVIPHA